MIYIAMLYSGAFVSYSFATESLAKGEHWAAVFFVIPGLTCAHEGLIKSKSLYRQKRSNKQK